MEVKYERCCGIDVHKQSVTACIIAPNAEGQVVKVKRSFGTMSDDLKALVAWLQEWQVTTGALESTGVNTPPPMLPIGGDIAGNSRQGRGADAENNANLVHVDLNTFDQSANDFAPGVKVSGLQPLFHFGTKRVQPVQDHPQFCFLLGSGIQLLRLGLEVL